MSVSRLDMRAVAMSRGWLGPASVAVALALSGCAAETVQHYAHGKEHFSQKKYGHASPKVIADGQPVPKGGGQYLVGHPYSVAGHTYVPSEMTRYTAVGMASWYGAAFHGRRTANGEIYDMGSITAAHPTMPLPSYARVTNLDNGYSVIVRVNDRGPYHGGRVMDVSSRAADVLGFKGAGTAKIKVDYVGPAPLEGTDDNVLLASLRTDGGPAHIDGFAEPVMVADNQPAPGLSIFAALFGSGRAEPPPPSLPPPAPPVFARGRLRRSRRLSRRRRTSKSQPPSPSPRPRAGSPPRRRRAGFTGPFRCRRRARSTSASPTARPWPPLRPPRNARLRPQARCCRRGVPELHASVEKALYFTDAASDRVRRLTQSAFRRVKPAPEGDDD